VQPHGTATPQDERETAVRARPWIAYLTFALLWPIVVEAIVLVLGSAASLGPPVLSDIAATGIPLLTGALSWWTAARLRSNARLPSRLWVVPAAWAAVAVFIAVFAFGLADQRSVFGVFGVLGSFVLGAIGFWLGYRRLI
jgi:hypothetical protein